MQFKCYACRHSVDLLTSNWQGELSFLRIFHNRFKFPFFSFNPELESRMDGRTNERSAVVMWSPMVGLHKTKASDELNCLELKWNPRFVHLTINRWLLVLLSVTLITSIMTDRQTDSISFSSAVLLLLLMVLKTTDTFEVIFIPACTASLASQLAGHSLQATKQPKCQNQVLVAYSKNILSEHAVYCPVVAAADCCNWSLQSIYTVSQKNCTLLVSSITLSNVAGSILMTVLNAKYLRTKYVKLNLTESHLIIM